MSNIFAGKLVRLRAPEPTDWEAFFQADRDSTDPGRLTDSIWFPSSTVGARAWAEREAQRPEGEAFRFMIERLDGTLVGAINTHGCDPRNGTFKYGLAIFPVFQRQGYGSEAIRLVLGYYFLERRYQKVTVEVFAFNEPSIRLHERLGFTLEGRLRRMIYTGGEYHDALLYGLTREEFEASNQR
jgi:RimJ/RimL family protein N-acetyltransferase